MYAAFNIIGPILLLIALIYFTVRYWKRRPVDEARAEQGARELREQLNKEDVTRKEGSR